MNIIDRIITWILNPRLSFRDIPGFSENLPPESGDPLDGLKIKKLKVKDFLTNTPLLLGIIIVFGLFLLVLFGPIWSPENPYISGQHVVPHYDWEKEVFIRPPLEPSEEYPLGTNQWGMDIMSMLMHGARNTLVACAFITLVRVLVGLVFGAIAGWNEKKPVDNLIMGLIGIITSLPLLISTMILIFALDIRGGMLTFIIGLSLLGWTEIAQYIRSEFLVLKEQPYIQGAQSLGLNGFQIAINHVLPNILPQLLVITFLEMGAVLMLLGELGFVGVYIGGGSRIDLTEPMSPPNIVTLTQIPEWGAMIAEGFRWFRSKPFIVGPPAAAFFISVFGFTALGEGFRRLIKKEGFNTAFLLKKQMLVVIVIISASTWFILNNTGAGPWYSKVATSFDGKQVYAHVETLTEMEGRGVGQPGSEEAANYIADRFNAYGLAPGWKNGSFFYEVETIVVRPKDQPTFTVNDTNGNNLLSFEHQIEFGYMLEGHGGSGLAEAPIIFVGFDNDIEQFGWRDYKGLDFRGRIVMVIQGNAPDNFATEALIRGAEGIIWVTKTNETQIRSQIQASNSGLTYLSNPTLPIFRIHPITADTILELEDASINKLLYDLTYSHQEGTGWHTVKLNISISMSLILDEPMEYQVPSVMGYFPGSDFDLSDELIIVYTNYDGMGMEADGTIFPSANNNASGVGLLLEIARLWQEQGLDPRRSVMFIAWGGETQLDNSGINDLLSTNINFRHLTTNSLSRTTRPSIFIEIEGLGRGGDNLVVHPLTDNDLFDLLLEINPEDNNIIITKSDNKTEFVGNRNGYQVPSWMSIKWGGENISLQEDTLDQLSEEKLQQFGELFVLFLTQLVRETTF